MQVDDKLVDKLSGLARLEFEGEARERMKNDLGRILGFVQKLEEVDTTGVEPLIYMTNETNTLREDVVHQDISREEALKNAPQKDSDYFKVPKVLSK